MVVMLSMLASVVMGQELLQEEDESFLIQARNVKARVGYHKEFADPVDVASNEQPGCVDSEGATWPGVVEDCTRKDFFVWKGSGDGFAVPS